MALCYLLDEHFRGDIWDAIQHHNAQAVDPIDAVRVGDPPDLPLASLDSDILAWAERAGRVLVSRDRRTMIAELAAHLQAGRSCPGLFMVRRRSRLADVLVFLVAAAQAGDEDQWRNQVIWIPERASIPFRSASPPPGRGARWVDRRTGGEAARQAGPPGGPGPGSRIGRDPGRVPGRAGRVGTDRPEMEPALFKSVTGADR